MAKKEKLSLEDLLEQALVKDEDKPYAVPENWVWTKAQYVFEQPREQVDPVKSIVLNYIGLEHMKKGGGIGSIATTVGLKSNKVSFNKGDILYGKLRPYLNKHAVVDFDGIASTDIVVFHPNASMNSWLFDYYLNLPLVINYVVERSKGINLPRVSPGDLGVLPIPLAPLPEQQRIVALIDSLFGKLDRAKEFAQNALDSFENRKSAILHKAFTGELTSKWREENGASLDSWEERLVRNLGEVKGGKRLPKGETLVNENTGFPYIKAGDLKEGTVLTDKLQFVTEEIQKIIKNYTVKTGDVYVTIVGACIGDVGVIPEEMNGANLTENAAKITNLICDSRYLGICLGSVNVQKQIKNKISSATLGKLSLLNIKSLIVPIPPLSEQKEIVRILNNLLENEQKAKELCDVIDKIDHMKKTILARVFRGELSTNNPAEESAVELLKEVLKEKL